jgi:Tfp pilus assembly protein PilO
MKRADLTILLGLVGIGLIAVFWFVVLAPKRDEAAALEEKVTALEESVATAEDQAAFAEAARDDYDKNYHRLVVLGQAVPEDSDSPSLLVELQKLADKSKVSFDGLALAEGADAAAQPAAPAPPPAEGGEGSEETPDEGATPPAGGGEAAPPTATPASSTTQAAATEATAATLPIGATVGPAGLPTMPYDLSFSGDYFQVADFFEGVDDLVHTADGDVSVDGRLLTVDGFTLTSESDDPATATTAAAAFDPTPALNVTLATTTYVTPAEQGLVAGADPAAPAPTTPAAPTPTSTPAPAP